MWKNGLFIAQGIGTTLSYTMLAFAIGLVCGLILAIVQHKNYMRSLIDGVVSIVRGTPLILQLSLFYFSIPQWTSLRLSFFEAAILAFGLNSMAYMTEIFKGGIQSIPQGQFDAAFTLGIPAPLMWRDIIIPQLVARVFPSLLNELIALLKETAIVSFFGDMDIMKRAQLISAQSFDYFTPLLWAALWYYTLVVIIEKTGRYIEKKWLHAPCS